MTALGAAVATPLLPEACFLSMPALVALVLGEHQDYRYRRGMGGTLRPELDARTSNVPLLALLCGRQEPGQPWQEGWRRLGDELKWGNCVAALLVAGGLQARRGRALAAAGGALFRRGAAAAGGGGGAARFV